MGQLLALGIESVGVNAASDALSVMSAEPEPFAMALIDQQMPECDGVELGRRIKAADSRVSSTPLVLLTSSVEKGDVSRFERLGFVGCLAKPVLVRELAACLETVLSNEAEVRQDRTSIRAIDSPPALEVRKRRILLAEDNPVNEKVAMHTLRKLGYEVHAVPNGQTAVAAWRDGNYDLILMDCQMPILDGYEATREIRALEAGRGRIPIVALTAHAMKEDDLKCTAAGMDHHLTKPLDRERLQACLNHYFDSPNEAKDTGSEAA
jgi:CheY-like chemotaxis protein